MRITPRITKQITNLNKAIENISFSRGRALEHLHQSNLNLLKGVLSPTLTKMIAPVLTAFASVPYILGKRVSFAYQKNLALKEANLLSKETKNVVNEENFQNNVEGIASKVNKIVGVVSFNIQQIEPEAPAVEEPEVETVAEEAPAAPAESAASDDFDSILEDLQSRRYPPPSSRLTDRPAPAPDIDIALDQAITAAEEAAVAEKAPAAPTEPATSDDFDSILEDLQSRRDPPSSSRLTDRPAPAPDIDIALDQAITAAEEAVAVEESEAETVAEEVAAPRREVVNFINMEAIHSAAIRAFARAQMYKGMPGASEVILEVEEYANKAALGAIYNNTEAANTFGKQMMDALNRMNALIKPMALSDDKLRAVINKFVKGAEKHCIGEGEIQEAANRVIEYGKLSEDLEGEALREAVKNMEQLYGDMIEKVLALEVKYGAYDGSPSPLERERVRRQDRITDETLYASLNIYNSPQLTRPQNQFIDRFVSNFLHKYTSGQITRDEEDRVPMLTQLKEAFKDTFPDFPFDEKVQEVSNVAFSVYVTKAALGFYSHVMKMRRSEKIDQGTLRKKRHFSDIKFDGPKALEILSSSLREALPKDFPDLDLDGLNLTRVANDALRKVGSYREKSRILEQSPKTRKRRLPSEAAERWIDDIPSDPPQ